VLVREPARPTAHATRRPATRDRPKSRVGLVLAARSSGEAAHMLARCGPRSPAARITPGAPVGPRGGAGQCGGRRGSPGKWVDEGGGGGRKRRFIGVPRQQWDPVARGGSRTLQQLEREKRVRARWGSGKRRLRRRSPEAGEDGAGVAEMPPVVAGSSSGG
jgi:hypothetical protein